MLLLCLFTRLFLCDQFLHRFWTLAAHAFLGISCASHNVVGVGPHLDHGDESG